MFVGCDWYFFYTCTEETSMMSLILLNYSFKIKLGLLKAKIVSREKTSMERTSMQSKI